MLAVALVPDDIRLAAMGAQLHERRYLCLAFEAETITCSDGKTRKLHQLFLHVYFLYNVDRRETAQGRA